MRFVLVSIVATLTACAATPPPAPPSQAPAPAATAAASPAAPAAEMAPTPYTAAQIRDASPAGRRVVYKVEEDGKPAVRRVIEFVKSDANGADTRASTMDSSGRVLDSTEEHASWDELRSHAEFPKGDVDIKHRTISVPLGTLECTVYKVTGQNGAVTTLYFADTLPGPPVFFYVEVGGKRVRTQTMEANERK